MRYTYLLALVLAACAAEPPLECGLADHSLTGAWRASFTSLTGNCGGLADEVVDLDATDPPPCDAPSEPTALRDFHHAAACALDAQGKASADGCRETLSGKFGPAAFAGVLAQTSADSISWWFSAEVAASPGVSACYGTYSATIVRIE